MLTKREHRDSTGKYIHIEPLSPDDIPGLPEWIGICLAACFGVLALWGLTYILFSL